MTTRITGGALRGRRLQTPKGEGVRPTSSRVRESIFSILGHDLGGLRVLDLCAGAGTLGIEAASRGARSVVFVEQSRAHARVLQKNVALLDGLAEHRVLQADAARAPQLLAGEGAFDLVFVDAPYAGDVAGRVVAALGAADDALLDADVTVAVETDASAELPDPAGALHVADRRTWGRTSLTLYRKGAA